MIDDVKVLLRYKENLIDTLAKHMNDDLDNPNCASLVNNLFHAYKSDLTSLAMLGYEEGESGYYNDRSGVNRMPRPYYIQGSGMHYDGSHSRGGDDEYLRALMDLKSKAPDEHTAHEIQRMIDDRR